MNLRFCLQHWFFCLKIWCKHHNNIKLYDFLCPTYIKPSVICDTSIFISMFNLQITCFTSFLDKLVSYMHIHSTFSKLWLSRTTYMGNPKPHTRAWWHSPILMFGEKWMITIYISHVNHFCNKYKKWAEFLCSQ